MTDTLPSSELVKRIEALEKELAKMDAAADMANRQWQAALTRAQSAEAQRDALVEALLKVGEIASPPDELGSDWHSEAIMLGEKLDRIAAVVIAAIAKEPTQ